MPQIAGKTVGLSVGAGGAIAYAKHATTATVYALGLDQLPPEALEATRELMTGFYGVVMLLLAMWIGHIMNKAAAAWGHPAPESTPEQAERRL